MAREEDKDLKKDNVAGEETPGTAKEERRRFVKGAIATPVLLTVASRPAMGGNFCTPSGFLSGNLSTPEVSCNGRSPGYWRNRFPNQYESTTFSQVFKGVWHHQTGVPWDPAITLRQVLGLESADDQYKFGFHSTGCYFNAVYGSQLGYPMTVEEVVKVVSDVITFGYYTDPTTGLTMDVLETINFLKGTYH